MIEYTKTIGNISKNNKWLDLSLNKKKDIKATTFLDVESAIKSKVNINDIERIYRDKKFE